MPAIDNRTYQRERQARLRAEWFAGKQCYRCGSTEKLQLDHRDPGLKVGHSIWSWSRQRREEELAKCQVLCDPCHRWKSRGCGESGSTLFADDVREIRRRAAAGEAQAALGREFSITRSSVYDIVHFRSWADLT